MRRIFMIVVLLAVTVTFPVSAQPRPYTIDVILSLTGLAAALGADEAAAYAAYEKVANAGGGLHGQPIHFEIHDDQSNPATAVALLGPILARRPAVVMGSTLAGPTQAMAALVKNGPVLYAATPNVMPEKGSYVFGAGPLTTWYNSAALRFFSKRGLTRIATITTNDASGQNNLAGLEAALRYPDGRGTRIVDRESFGLGDISIASQVARLKSANPQVVFAYPNGTAFGAALLQSRSQSERSAQGAYRRILRRPGGRRDRASDGRAHVRLGSRSDRGDGLASARAERRRAAASR